MVKKYVTVKELRELLNQFEDDCLVLNDGGYVTALQGVDECLCISENSKNTSPYIQTYDYDYISHDTHPTYHQKGKRACMLSFEGDCHNVNYYKNPTYDKDSDNDEYAFLTNTVK